MLVVIDGPDCVGKSTLLKNLLVMDARYTFLASFPKLSGLSKISDNVDTETLEMVRHYILGKLKLDQLTFQRLCLNILQYSEDVLKEAKENTDYIYLVDRYYFSTLVYGLVFNESTYNKTDWTTECLYRINKMVSPDVSLILLDDPRNIKKRIRIKNNSDVFDSQLNKKLFKLIKEYVNISAYFRDVDYLFVNYITERETATRAHIKIQKGLMFNNV